MRRLILLLVLTSFSCGPIPPGQRPLATATERGVKIAVTVVVEDNQNTMYCAQPDAAEDIRCTVGYEYLLQNADGDWQMIVPDEARRICYQGLRTSYVSRETVELCKFALLRIRFTKLVPKPEGQE